MTRFISFFLTLVIFQFSSDSHAQQVPDKSLKIREWNIPTEAPQVIRNQWVPPGETMDRVEHPERCFKIKVVDDRTHRGVPMVELKTNHEVCYHTDNNGIVAFYEPGLMNQDVYFHIRSHGYEFPADGFGFRGRAVKTIPGDSIVLKNACNSDTNRAG